MMNSWISVACSCLVLAGQATAQEAKPDAMKFDNMPRGVFEQMFDLTKSTGFPGLAWTGAPGQVRRVTVAFNGGTEQARALIEATANEWTAKGGRVRWSFRTASGAWRTWATSDAQAKANIRIGFFTDAANGGYWSAVGTLARRYYANAPTMNYDDLGTSLANYDPVNKKEEWLNSYAHSVILHEFGHALGLNHEHFHPKCQADLKLDEAIASFTNWKPELARFNVDAAYYFQTMAPFTNGQKPVTSPDSDRASVMLYRYSDSIYRSGVNSPCRPTGTQGYATSLSAQDRAYFAMVYGSSQ